ncbi:MAG: TolC family protein [Azospirillaceae bacterium]|nr:TolC family protein [Azospirillaceae bacterium]
MSLLPGLSLSAKRWRCVAGIAVLPLTACATDALTLAPASPQQPWVIPGVTGGRAVAVADANARSPGILVPAVAEDHAPSDAAPPDSGSARDLPGLIDLAQRSNPETREAWERARQAALEVGLREASFVPQISAEIVGGFQHTPLPIPTSLIPKGYFLSDTRELIPALTAKWLLFDFGQRTGVERAARANSFVANAAFTGAHQKVIYAVSRDYFALSAARGRLRVAAQALKNAQIVEDAVETRRAHGLATIVERTQARRQTAQARFNLERATGAEHAALAALVHSVGVPPGTRIAVADDADQPLPRAEAGDVDQFIHDALANRPDIIAAMGKIRAAEATLDSARARYYPTLGLEAQVYENIGGLSTQGSQYYSVNEPGAAILLKLSLPLYDGGVREAGVALAQSEIAAAQAALDQTRDAAAQQVTDAYDALRTSFAEYSAALAVNEAARTAYDAALESYRQGVGTYTDTVTGATALSQAQSQQADAHANVFTAAAALAFATGSIAAAP